MKLPDPGHAVTVPPRRFKVLDGHEALIERFGGFAFERLADIEGMAVLRAESKLFWGRLSVANERYFVKARRLVGAKRRLRSLWRLAPLRLEWRLSSWAYEQGLPTAQPVAVGVRRRFGMVEEGILITRWLEDVEELDRVLERARSKPSAHAARERYAHALGALCARLHEAGATHRQLHGKNILIEAPGSARERMVLVDLMHLSVFPAPLDWEQRASNLYQLAFYQRESIAHAGLSARVALAFARGYLGEQARAKAFARWLLALWPKQPLERRPRRREALKRVRTLGPPW